MFLPESLYLSRIIQWNIAQLCRFWGLFEKTLWYIESDDLLEALLNKTVQLISNAVRCV